MRIAVTGATGFIGSGLTAHLAADGHDVVPLARGGSGPRWDPERPFIETDGPIDALVHLAGHPVAVRWTKANRRRILESRTKGTQNLAKALAAMPDPPSVMVSGSAAGWYGHTGDQEVDESGPAGEGFLATVVQGWEAAAQPARDAGIRVVHPRPGIVLGRSGGALPRMLPPFKIGVGGAVGSGKQYLAWIHYGDTIAALAHLLESDLEGPVNVVAPEEARFKEFADALGRALHRPTFMRVPTFAIRIMYGQMGKEMLVQGQRMVPRRLAGDGFQWRHPGLDEALEDLFAT